VSQDGDGSEPESDGAVKTASEVPPTRKHETVDEPPARASSLRLDDEPLVYPDDGSMARRMRSFDDMLGTVERIILMGLLAILVVVGAMQVIATKLFDHSFPWSFDVIRGGTFAIAMLASAYASQQGSHICMDIITRKLPPRRKLISRVVLGLVTIFAAILLVWMGMRMVNLLAKEGGSSEHTIPQHWLAMLIPIGGGLIIFHTLVRMTIDVDYLVRGKLPPERAPAAH
jgi:TRAP-type C4-dicarboxylate transport system permease small subunit